MNAPRDDPDLPSSSSRLLDDLYEEITAKVLAGQAVDVEEYARRFPAFASRLSDLIHTVEALAQLGLSRSSHRLASPFLASSASLTPAEPVAGTLGDFRILRQIGQGGMGVVYEAEQISLRRRVALKVLPFASVLDPRQLQRFKNEAQAAASLRHPNIVQVYAVGCQSAVHFYAMEYIEGQTLADAIHQLQAKRRAERPPADRPAVADEPTQDASGGQVPPTQSSAAVPQPLLGKPKDMPRQPPPCQYSQETLGWLSTQGGRGDRQYFQTVANLGIQAAEALEHAHQMGVVHRDIKPSNLIVDASGHLWITDFGLAMTQSSSDLTLTGDVLGTLRYMSPEQIQGWHRVMDHRTDIYSLGATLYELATLQPAFADKDRHVLFRKIVEEEPRRPSLRNSEIPRDLECIILKALAKEPQRRYATAAALADDLRRFLQQQPITARPQTAADRLVKWTRRHVRAVAASVGILLVLCAVMAAATMAVLVQMRRTESARLQAVAAMSDAQQARQWADAERNKAQRVSANLALDRALALCEQGDVAQGVLWLVRAVQTVPADAGELARVIRRNLAAWSRRVTVLDDVAVVAPESTWHAVAFSPDGHVALAAAADCSVWEWNWATTEADPRSPVAPQPALVVPASADRHSSEPGEQDRLKAAAQARESPAADCPRPDASLGETRPHGLHSLEPLGAPRLRHSACRPPYFSLDARLLVTAQPDGTIQFVDPQTQAVVFQRRDAPKLQPSQVALSPDGTVAVVGSGGLTAEILDIKTGSRIGGAVSDFGEVLGFLPDGRTVFTASLYSLYFHDPRDGRLLRGPLTRQNGVYCVVFSPDGQRAVVGSEFDARVWDLERNEPLGQPMYHGGVVRCVAFSPAGTVVATGSEDGLARRWDAASGRPVGGPLRHNGRLCAVRFLPDGRTLLTGARDNPVRRWILPPADVYQHRLEHPAEVRLVALSPDGRHLLSGCCDRAIRLWDLQTGTLLRGPVAVAHQPADAAFHPDGRRYATLDTDGRVRLWDTASGDCLAESEWKLAGPQYLKFASAGTHLIALSGRGTAVVVDAQTLAQLETQPSVHRGRKSVGLSLEESVLLRAARKKHPSGPAAAAMPPPQEAVVRATDTVTQTTAGAGGPPPWLAPDVRSLAFSADGARVTTCSLSGAIWRWDTLRGVALQELAPNQRGKKAIVFSPDGRTALAIYGSGQARLLDLPADRPIGPPLEHHSAQEFALFSDDGRVLATLDPERRTICVYRVPLDLEGTPPRLALWAQTLTGVALDADGYLDVCDGPAWRRAKQELEDLGGPPAPE